MDVKIPELPHSVVKRAQSTSVRELIQKIENHPDRHALQQDLRQNQSFNTFSPESKQMIRDVGNIELCELHETEPRTQCEVCLSYWDIGIVYCTCGHFLRQGTEENKKFIRRPERDAEMQTGGQEAPVTRKRSDETDAERLEEEVTNAEADSDRRLGLKRKAEGDPNVSEVENTVLNQFTCGGVA